MGTYPNNIASSLTCVLIILASPGKGKISRIRHIKSIIRELYLLSRSPAPSRSRSWVKCQFGLALRTWKGEAWQPAGRLSRRPKPKQINPYLFDSFQSETRRGGGQGLSSLGF